MTIDQIARELNLAKSTVSRALNGYPDISEDTRERVTRTALSLGYTASSAARNLKRGRLDTVGIVLPGDELDISSPFLVQFLRGATAVLEQRGLDLLVASSPSGQDWQPTYERLIAGRKVDGLILTRTLADDPRVAFLNRTRFPFVCYGRTRSPEDFAWLDIDCGPAMREAVRRATALGHRRIGFVCAPTEVNFARLQREAFEEAAQAAGLDTSLVIEAGLDSADGAEAARGLLALPEPPTAILCGLDVLAFGVMHALRDAGLRPGEEVSVIGYGDVQFAAFHQPPLSTFSQDARNAGAWTAEMLIALLQGTTAALLQRLRPATFVERATLGAPVLSPEALAERLKRPAA
ncbi:LacI family DNA-binding transcriptional regulator [Oceanicella sp. SM1341]|uniref:LacI family DNA-binding transcriptional regulator n=1 Tax=Oceanicella sp. SM1341 TaxID=1548889 RepID=UPI0018E579B7|nr:substrate-binding domain-containing protein [Oceanicella sp. SM1341]